MFWISFIKWKMQRYESLCFCKELALETEPCAGKGKGENTEHNRIKHINLFKLSLLSLLSAIIVWVLSAEVAKYMEWLVRNKQKCSISNTYFPYILTYKLWSLLKLAIKILHVREGLCFFNLGNPFYFHGSYRRIDKQLTWQLATIKQSYLRIIWNILKVHIDTDASINISTFQRKNSCLEKTRFDLGSSSWRNNEIEICIIWMIYRDTHSGHCRKIKTTIIVYYSSKYNVVVNQQLLKQKSHITNRTELSAWPKCLGEAGLQSLRKVNKIGLSGSLEECLVPGSSKMALFNERDLAHQLGQTETMGDKQSHK